MFVRIVPAMFDAIRNGAQSTPVKVLLLVLVLAFITWGVGDYFVGGAGRAAIKVNDQEISLTEVDRLQRNTREALEQQLGQPITAEMATQLQLPARVVVDLLRDALITSNANSMGFTASDERLRQALASTPAFQVSGSFDAMRYKQTLQTAGYDIAQFESELRGDITAQDFNSLFDRTAPYSANAGLERLMQQAKRQFDVEVLSVQASTLPAPEAPNDEAIADFYAQNQQYFLTQPTWDVLMVELTPETTIDQQTELDDRLAGGESLTDVAAALALSATTMTNVGADVITETLPQSARQTLQGLAVGQPSPLLSWGDNRSGYVELAAYNEPQVRPLEEVQSEIVDMMTQQSQVQQLRTLGQTLVTTARNAVTFNQLAKQYNGTVQYFTNTAAENNELASLIGNANAADLRTLPQNHVLAQPVLREDVVRIVRVTQLHDATLTTEDHSQAQVAYTDGLKEEAYQLMVQNLAEQAKVTYNIPALRLVFGENFNANQLPQLEL